jgi:hypothetical protein
LGGDIGVDGKIIIEVDLRETGHEDEDWVHVAQDGDRRWLHLNTAVNRRIP